MLPGVAERAVATLRRRDCGRAQLNERTALFPLHVAADLQGMSSPSDVPIGREPRAHSTAACGAHRHLCGRSVSRLPFIVKATPKAGSSKM